MLAHRVQPAASNRVRPPQTSVPKPDLEQSKRWILFLMHARTCSAPKGTCRVVQSGVRCLEAQKLNSHIDGCWSMNCGFQRCSFSKTLVKHVCNCVREDCPLCVHVREYLKSMHRQSDASRRSTNAPPIKRASSFLEIAAGANPAKRIKPTPHRNVDGSVGRPMNRVSSVIAVDSQRNRNADDGSSGSLMKRRLMACQDVQPAKRVRVSAPEVGTIHVKHASNPSQPKKNVVTLTSKRLSSVCGISEELNFSKRRKPEHKYSSVGTSISSSDPGQGNAHVSDNTALVSEPLVAITIAKKDDMAIKTVNDPSKSEVEKATDVAADHLAGSKSVMPKRCVSLTELFTVEQIKEHIRSLRQCNSQRKAKSENNGASEQSTSENSCNLCAMRDLKFESLPIYCSRCSGRIELNATYYTMRCGENAHFFCLRCYSMARGDALDIDGSAFPKTSFKEKKNDKETEELWVRCGKCQFSQHQICALYNLRRDDGRKSEYTCPNCYIEELQNAEHKPLPENAIPGAKDLPRTFLSDFIEDRLHRRLEEERLERAKHSGKGRNEVPGAEKLIVRVVLSVDKKCEVKQQFSEFFQEVDYPTEFPYKSKAILLFQEIEGVDVCLFGIYSQEYGSDCPLPNQRRVFLSYLDSVKYFRPDVQTVTGESLRTFVYQEIMISYLEYCKNRGFGSCSLWACPPMKGDDYILYCHPRMQKTPNRRKLTEWYLAMFQKAMKEKVVTAITNLYDNFFVNPGECKAKVTVSRLPYFDGDYWPGEAYDIIMKLRKEHDDGKQKKGTLKKVLIERALKAVGHANLTCNASKYVLLMQKLGEAVYPKRKEHMVVHLQHACAHCCLPIMSGICWDCVKCKNFHLCDKCHNVEEELEERDRHPINSRQKHVLSLVESSSVPLVTDDKDEIIGNEFFDTRHAFLSLCQGNHYQFDTLRRAKYSSMMFLHHLHNPTEPAFVTTCDVCEDEVKSGKSWRCQTCPDYDICNACYEKFGAASHPHTLRNHQSIYP